MASLSTLNQIIVFASISTFMLPTTNGQALDVLSIMPIHKSKETRFQTAPDTEGDDAVTEACFTLLAFGAAAATIHLLKQRSRKTKVACDAARKAENFMTKIPSIPAAGVPSETLQNGDAYNHSGGDTMRARVSGARDTKTPSRTPSGTSTDADKLVAAVRAGKAVELPLMMDAARMRLVDAGATPEAVEAAAAQHLMSTLRACAAHHHFVEALAAFDYARRHIGVGCSSMWSLLLYSSVESKQYSRCADFFKNLIEQTAPSPNDFLNMVRYHAHQQDPEGLKNTLVELRRIDFQFDTISRNRALSVCFTTRGERLVDILVDSEYCEVAMDIVGYNTMLKGYAKLGDVSRCFEIYDMMKEGGLPSSEVTFGILLDVCIDSKAFDRAKKIFETLQGSGLKVNVVHYTTFMKGLINAGHLEEATNLLDEMLASPNTRPDLVTYSTLVKAHADSGQVMEATQVLERMFVQRITPDAIIFNIVLTGCTVKVMQPEQVFHVFKWLVNHGLQTSTTTLSILVKAFAKSQSWSSALHMLSSAPERLKIWPEPRLYTQLAQAAAKAGNGAAAVETYKAMVMTAVAQGTAVDEATNLRLLKVCSNCAESSLAAKIHRAVARAGGYPTLDALNF